MSESRWVTVNNEADIISARLYTRQMAKDAGLQIMDQARISLAVSSLAHIIHLGERHSGQIIINRIDEDGRTGVQVIWILKPGDDYSTLIKELDTSSLEAMVDEISTRTSPETGIYITATKWNGPAHS